MVSAVQDESAPERRGLSAPELRGFREVQRLAYACAEAVAGQLRSGVTEREAARMQRVWLRERGVRDWFHLPFAWFGDRTAFAWFGDRTAFAGFKVPLQFFPTNRKLEPGMPFILDMAPVYKGYTADIGYSGCLGLNPLHDRLLADLEAHRELILREVRERRSLREIYEDVERLMTAQGYANRHRAYPFGVIAHKVDRVAERRWSPQVFGFGTQSLKGLVSDALHGHRDGWSPLWSPYSFSDHPPQPGLWAVEPHLGFRGTGAKFEEILVVTDSKDPEQSAFWLDDDLPHVRRWAEEKVAA
ncbi:Peptidase_M24 domain containing protein [Streptomyces microflavus DSM 40593]|uniref:Peptidase_M24 domain containing protein n=1 Tax=Streptomyces microflavus DSM 40593 TaxID=1303692 RepID=N0CUM1_STRMI|nr:M24 family metallopeptidase [Streptomyces microflavus]AGK78549.1 Peptidase_M24 domain containing protein [Streptomyces microflavus DSM 40593]